MLRHFRPAFRKAVHRQAQTGGLHKRMADKALAALKSLWSKLPIKAPWKVRCSHTLHSPVLPVLACKPTKVVELGWQLPVL